MAKTLRVYLNESLAGFLVQNEGGQLEFTYWPDYLRNPEAIPLSYSLPLRLEMFVAKECRGFFSGILPEETNRDIIAGNLGISSKNDFSMLKEIGGECAGAVTFLPEEAEAKPLNYSYRSLDEMELVAVINQLPQRPLLAGDKNVRLSLAGAQVKLTVLVEDDKIAIPLQDAPSTHILKPASKYFDGLVYNEAFCMMLADLCRLPTAKVEVRKAGSEEFLLIERFDRKEFIGEHSSPEFRIKERLHQEDFCQALGILSQDKYQKEGGPSLSDSFNLVSQNSRIPLLDRQRLLDAVIFNFLIGNNDAHGKNFSFTYDFKEGKIEARLAPLYDLICTAFYPNLDRKMAMKIGGESELSKIGMKHFEKFAEEASLSKPQVKIRVHELAQKVLDTIPKVQLEHPIAKGVGDWTKDHCLEVLNWSN
jgi:serine/threonine-protein kinase HipA